MRGADGKVRPAIVRFSRGGAGKPGHPDILGVAVKVEESLGAEQDYLLVTSLGKGGPLARIPKLSSDFGGKPVSSITSFQLGRVRGPITAELPAELRTPLDLGGATSSGEPQVFQLELHNTAVSRLLRGGPKRVSLGDVTVHFDQPLTAEESAALHMTPFHTASGVEPVGWINHLRKAAYRGSQRGREQAGDSPR